MIVNLSVNCSCACVEENHGNFSMFLVWTLSYNAPVSFFFILNSKRKAFRLQEKFQNGESRQWHWKYKHNSSGDRKNEPDWARLHNCVVLLTRRDNHYRKWTHPDFFCNEPEVKNRDQYVYRQFVVEWYPCGSRVYPLLDIHLSESVHRAPLHQRRIPILHHVWHFYRERFHLATNVHQYRTLSRNRQAVTSQNSSHESVLRHDSNSVVVRRHNGELATGAIQALDRSVHTSHDNHVLFRPICNHSRRVHHHLRVCAIKAHKYVITSPCTQESLQQRDKVICHGCHDNPAVHHSVDATVRCQCLSNLPSTKTTLPTGDGSTLKVC